jgi:hypothetical protein
MVFVCRSVANLAKTRFSVIDLVRFWQNDQKHLGILLCKLFQMGSRDESLEKLNKKF